ncbi:MAG: choice-of-anchor tandem repeat GloVer-containing protein, partial [Bryobacteraceae bacterium]
MKRIVSELGKLSWAKRACVVFMLSAMTEIALPAQTFTSLFSFDGADGQSPSAELVQATNGDLYGTTTTGGANGGGTIFKIAPGGTLTTLYNFCSQTNCTDGQSPYAGLVQATNGYLYGTTTAGGANGDGTIFQMNPGGTLT